MIVNNNDVLTQAAAIAAKWKDRPGGLLYVLHEVQAIAGNAIPLEVAEVVSSEMRLPLSQIHNVATFYSFFSTERRGEVIIRLCKSAPCHVNGSGTILAAFERVLGIQAGQTTPDGRFTLEMCECIGACDVSPAALINDTVYGNLTPAKVEELINTLGKKE